MLLREVHSMNLLSLVQYLRERHAFLFEGLCGLRSFLPNGAAISSNLLATGILHGAPQKGREFDAVLHESTRQL